MWLYDLPNWGMGIVVVGTTMAAFIGSYLLFGRLVRFEATDEQKTLTMTVLPIVATVHSLLLAFSAVSVWEGFTSADVAVVEEANAIVQIARDLAVYESAESRHARELLRTYARSVVDSEWREMQRGRASMESWEKFDDLFRAVAKLEPDTPKRVALLPEILSKINELVRLRRDRLQTSTAAIPGTLWSVVLIGTILTMATMIVLPRTRFNVMVVGWLSCSIGLVFFFLIAMDRPFAGSESISSTPFVTALYSMDRWDQATVAK